jgi:hypothetical protein
MRPGMMLAAVDPQDDDDLCQISATRDLTARDLFAAAIPATIIPAHGAMWEVCQWVRATHYVEALGVPLTDLVAQSVRRGSRDSRQRVFWYSAADGSTPPHSQWRWGMDGPGEAWERSLAIVAPRRMTMWLRRNHPRHLEAWEASLAMAVLCGDAEHGLGRSARVRRERAESSRRMTAMVGAGNPLAEVWREEPVEPPKEDV